MANAEGQTPVRVKVCGITSVADALACAEVGVDWVGLNFHPASVRFVSVDLAAEIARALPASCVPVGLFVNRPPSEVIATAKRVGLSIVQLHGDEPPEDLVALARFSVVRAFRIGSLSDIAAMFVYLDRARALGHPPYAILVDAFVAGQPGGTGHAITSDLLDALPFSSSRLILAGGLNPENVGGCVRHVRPWMVDVASGVESVPGKKDWGKVWAFVESVRVR